MWEVGFEPGYDLVTWTAEGVGNPGGMSSDVRGLVLWGEGLWLQESVLTGQTKHWVLLGRSMDPVCPYLNNIITCRWNILGGMQKRKIIINIGCFLGFFFGSLKATLLLFVYDRGDIPYTDIPYQLVTWFTADIMIVLLHCETNATHSTCISICTHACRFESVRKSALTCNKFCFISAMSCVD